MSRQPWIWTSSCRILFARQGQSQGWPETCWKVRMAGDGTGRRLAWSERGKGLQEGWGGPARMEVGVQLVSSAAVLVKFCPGFLLHGHQVMNFKCLEGERTEQERSTASFSFCSRVLFAASSVVKLWGFSCQHCYRC